MRSKNALRNIASNLILQSLIVLNGFIIPRIIIGSFGSDINGLVSSITQFLAYITLLESGFGPVVKAALYKPIAERNATTIKMILKTTEKFFRRIAFIFLIYIFILCILYPIIIEGNYEWIFTASLILVIGISTFAEYFFGITYKLYLQAKQKTYIASYIQIASYILSIALVVILAKLGASIHIIKLASGLVFLLRPIIQNIYVKKKYKIVLRNTPSNYIIKQKWDGLIQHIAAVIHGNTDITVLTFFATLSEVSVYSVYYLVVKGIKSLIQALMNGIDATFGDMIAKNEKHNLNKKFSMYETLYNTIGAIVFTCTIILITPFIEVYTHGVSDANYFRPLFGVLITISEYIWAIRLPYATITHSAGHFKETRRGALVECIANIVISIALVNWLGIIGVAIGTIIAMIIRSVEFIYHANKYILGRSMWKSIEKILLIVVETIVIVVICNFLPFAENSNYLNWGINAIMTAGVAGVVVLGFNAIFFRNELADAFSLLKNLTHRVKK